MGDEYSLANFIKVLDASTKGLTAVNSKTDWRFRFASALYDAATLKDHQVRAQSVAQVALAEGERLKHRRERERADTSADFYAIAQTGLTTTDGLQGRG